MNDWERLPGVAPTLEHGTPRAATSCAPSLRTVKRVKERATNQRAGRTVAAPVPRLRRKWLQGLTRGSSATNPKRPGVSGRPVPASPRR